eukprot:TRINITY_DN11436_c0_g1_i1.p1 TRINITY_DN11436_c0_g1~~TRINITY_DN11436_c0_g1_i1.p1  ORF type:complete len:101 (+),score=7.07 TRINITY_DN11436_c0_g1_i1:174-476(+)
MLKLACANDHAHLAVLLLNNGASANLLGGRPGFAPLHHAAANQNAPLISLLLARGAEVDARNEVCQGNLLCNMASKPACRRYCSSDKLPCISPLAHSRWP